MDSPDPFVLKGETFENINVVIRMGKSKKERLYNEQKGTNGQTMIY
jgi:hypothetical protein